MSTKVSSPSFIRSQNYENFLVILLRFSLVFVLLLPLVVNSTPFPDTIFPYLMGKALFFRISVEVMFIFWLSLLLINSKYKPKVSILLFVLGLFLFISLLSSLFSVDIDKSFWSTLDRMDGFIDLFHWFVYFLILISINVDWNAWIKYFNYQLIVGFVLVVLGLFEVLGFNSIPLILSGTSNGVTLGNSSYVAFYLSINFFIALALLSSSLVRDKSEIISTRASKRRAMKNLDSPVFDSFLIPRIFWSISIVLILVLFNFVAIDFHWISFSLGIITFSGLYIWLGKVNIFRTIVMGILVIVPVLLAALVDFENEFNSLISGYQSGGISYFGHISTQIGPFLSRPIFGWGPGNFLTAFESQIDTNFAIYFYNGGQIAYNYFAEKIISLGLLGLISILMLWGTIFYILIRNLKIVDKDKQIFLIVITGAVLSYFVQQLFIEETHVSKLQIFILISFVYFVDVTGNQVSLLNNLQEQINKRFSFYKRFLNPFVRYINFSLVAVSCFLVIYLIVFVNIPIYQGSKNIIKTMDSELEWSDRVSIYNDSINSFSPLSNHYRMMFLNETLTNFNSIQEEEFGLVMDFIQKIHKEGIDQDPNDWRIHVASAGIYQYASVNELSLLQKSSELVVQAKNISPNRIEIVQVQALQDFAEGNLSQGFNDVVSYIDKDPASLVHFSSLLFVFADQFQIEIMNGNNYIVEENKAIELISLIAPQTDRMVYVRATHHLLRNEVEIASSLIELHIKSNQFVGNKIIELKAVIDSRLK